MMFFCCYTRKWFNAMYTKRSITDFDNDFSFVSSVEEYNKDTWNNLDKYVKRKTNTRIDDRIAKARKKLRLLVSVNSRYVISKLNA